MQVIRDRAHPMATPSLPNEQLEKLKESEPDVDVHPVPERSGQTLMYVMLGTRLDLAYMVGILSQHTATPARPCPCAKTAPFGTFKQWHITRYASMEMSLGNSLVHQLQTGPTNINDCHSHLRVCVHDVRLCDQLSSKKQGSVALSSTKAEYMPVHMP